MNVVVVDLDRSDEQGLITLIGVCQVLTGQRVLVATAQDDDPALGAAVVMAGASGLLPRVRTRATLEDALAGAPWQASWSCPTTTSHRSSGRCR